MNAAEQTFWAAAAADLGLDVVCPFELALPDGSRIAASALVKNFGRRNGMIVADYDALKPAAQHLREAGYGYCASLGAAGYARAPMIEILKDWGWTGPAADKPAWMS